MLVMVRRSVLVGMRALMDMSMVVFAAIGVVMGMRMDAQRRFGTRMTMGVFMLMMVSVAMHRTVFVHMRMLMRLTFNFHLTRTTTTHCAHRLFSSSDYSISISLTRISVPRVG